MKCHTFALRPRPQPKSNMLGFRAEGGLRRAVSDGFGGVGAEFEVHLFGVLRASKTP